MTDQPFRYRLRVRYSECDAQQVVFNARYADYVDLAMTEFMRSLGRDYTALLERGLDNQVVKLTLEWQASARFDDILEVRVRTLHLGNTSFSLEHQIVNASSGENLCRAEAVYVMMTTEPFEKTRVPDDLRTALQEGAAGKMVDQSGGVKS
ncbi:acyl-CoA thioesterase [Alloalcanivorax mobilis]|uniref:acyl-CoA thioesterase n=1 Tax=Alloalcanivorax mobilis TaxID=2019569 RepID=UPI000C778BF1|nr:thioesterase family protein [Alloalcanivorax mobilis]